MKPVKGRIYWWPRRSVPVRCVSIGGWMANFEILVDSHYYEAGEEITARINAATGHLVRNDPWIGVIRALPSPDINIAVARGILRASADLPRPPLRSPKRASRARLLERRGVVPDGGPQRAARRRTR